MTTTFHAGTESFRVVPATEGVLPGFYVVNEDDTTGPGMGDDGPYESPEDAVMAHRGIAEDRGVTFTVEG